jgi:hypothetical protein
MCKFPEKFFVPTYSPDKGFLINSKLIKFKQCLKEPVTSQLQWRTVASHVHTNRLLVWDTLRVLAAILTL